MVKYQCNGILRDVNWRLASATLEEEEEGAVKREEIAEICTTLWCFSKGVAIVISTKLIDGFAVDWIQSRTLSIDPLGCGGGGGDRWWLPYSLLPLRLPLLRLALYLYILLAIFGRSNGSFIHIMIRPGIRFWNLVKKILRHGSGLASKPLLVFVTKEAGDALYNVAVISEIEERRKKEEGGQKAAGMGGPRCS